MLTSLPLDKNLLQKNDLMNSSWDLRQLLQEKLLNLWCRTRFVAWKRSPYSFASSFPIFDFFCIFTTEDVKDEANWAARVNVAQAKPRDAFALKSVFADILTHVWNNSQGRLDATIREHCGHFEQLSEAVNALKIT